MFLMTIGIDYKIHAVAIKSSLENALILNVLDSWFAMQTVTSTSVRHGHGLFLLQF